MHCEKQRICNQEEELREEPGEVQTLLNIIFDEVQQAKCHQAKLRGLFFVSINISDLQSRFDLFYTRLNGTTWIERLCLKHAALLELFGQQTT
jgi:hypothetical protein